MGLFSLFSQSKAAPELDLRAPYALNISCDDFIDAKISAIYSRVLSLCLSKSNLSGAYYSAMYDNANLGHNGLITCLADAMVRCTKIYLVYDGGIVRKADRPEIQQIQDDYNAYASSPNGAIMDFSNYKTSKLLKCYMAMVYSILETANTQVSLSKSLQIKIGGLRQTVAAPNAAEPIEAAKRLNDSLKAGKSVLLDSTDNILQVLPSTAPVREALSLVYSEIAQLLGMPLSFVSGELASGMAVTGEADSNAIEQGIKLFWLSIFKPVCDSLFKIDLQFVSENWRKLTQYVTQLPYIEASELLTDEEKRGFINWVLYDI